MPNYRLFSEDGDDIGEVRLLGPIAVGERVHILGGHSR
jgi:hypothetical protein